MNLRLLESIYPSTAVAEYASAVRKLADATAKLNADTAVAEHASAVRKLVDATAKLNAHTAASTKQKANDARVLNNLLALLRR